MFQQESKWIKKTIKKINLEKGDLVADIGSSDLFFRTRVQPHVHNDIYAPLQDKSVYITSIDAKEEIGVDCVVDITSKDPLPQAVANKKFDLVINCNMLEHVINRDTAVSNLISFVKKGGYLLITVPHTFLYHADPIDTMYRPTPEDVFTLLNRHCNCEVVEWEILPITQKNYYIMPVYPNRILHNLPFFGYRQAWRWFFPKYRWKVTCLMVKINS